MKNKLPFYEKVAYVWLYVCALYSHHIHQMLTKLWVIKVLVILFFTRINCNIYWRTNVRVSDVTHPYNVHSLCTAALLWGPTEEESTRRPCGGCWKKSDVTAASASIEVGSLHFLQAPSQDLQLSKCEKEHFVVKYILQQTYYFYLEDHFF